MINRLLIASFLAAFAVVLVTGCGDEDASGSIEEGSLTKTQFVNQANAICSEGRSVMLNAEEPKQDGLSEAEIVTLTFHEAWLPELEKVVAQVGDLGAPQGDGPEVEAILDSMEEAIDTAEESDSIPTLGRFEQIFTPAGSKARKYGIAACAYG